MILENLANLIHEFSLPGYTLAETAVYSAVLVFTLYAFFQIIRKLKIPIDEKLAVAIAPYIALGSLLRVLRDLELVAFGFLITPWIYAFILLLFAISLAFSILLEARFKIFFFKPLFFIGLAFVLLALIPLTAFGIRNPKAIGLVTALFLPWAILFKFIRWSMENKAVSLAQLFDGTVTSTGIGFFGYGEQHWLPNILISGFGPFSFLLSKLLFVVAALVALDKLCREKQVKNYTKLIIGALGVATGTRDFICLINLCTPH